jgi:hypothetical protein
MARFHNGPSALEWIRQRVANGEEATLAVAFWGNGAIEQIGLHSRPTANSVHIICNLKMGGTNPFEVERLCKLPNVTVQQSDKLHGKVYSFDRAALVGSANASANGLSFEGAEAFAWDEANIVVNNTKVLEDINNWISRLDARSINPEDLTSAKTAWQLRRQVIAPVIGNERRSVLELAGNATLLGGRGVYVAVYLADMSEEAEDEIERAKGEFGFLVDGFEDWKALPHNGTIICFRRGPRGGMNFDRVWKRLDVPDITLSNGYTVQLVVPGSVPSGFKRPSKELANWKVIIDRLVSRVGPVDETQSQCVDLSDPRLAL